MWKKALGEWDTLTAPDLHSIYHLDDQDPAFWERPWRSTMARVTALMGQPHSMLRASLAA